MSKLKQALNEVQAYKQTPEYRIKMLKEEMQRIEEIGKLGIAQDQEELRNYWRKLKKELNAYNS